VTACFCARRSDADFPLADKGGCIERVRFGSKPRSEPLAVTLIRRDHIRGMTGGADEFAIGGC
jgi:hypothetical protein